MDELSKYVSWVRYEQRTLEDHQMSNWQLQAECSICRTIAGQIDDDLAGAIYCSECPDRPLGCRVVADAERLERWIVWAGTKLMRDTQREPRERRIRRLRSRDIGARQEGARRVG